MWFKRNDGALMCAEENTASHQMMVKSPGFTPCDEQGNEINSEAEQPVNESNETSSADLLQTALSYEV